MHFCVLEFTTPAPKQRHFEEITQRMRDDLFLSHMWSGRKESVKVGPPQLTNSSRAIQYDWFRDIPQYIWGRFSCKMFLTISPALAYGGQPNSATNLDCYGLFIVNRPLFLFHISGINDHPYKMPGCRDTWSQDNCKMPHRIMFLGFGRLLCRGQGWGTNLNCLLRGERSWAKKAWDFCTTITAYCSGSDDDGYGSAIVLSGGTGLRIEWEQSLYSTSSRLPEAPSVG